MKSRKGFTLAELMIVIAIIAVLIAIAIPTFSGTLDGARLAVDATTERNALNAAKIEVLLLQDELDILAKDIRDELEERVQTDPEFEHYTEQQKKDYVNNVVGQGWYYYYDPASGYLKPAFDTPHADKVTYKELESYKVGKWKDHKDKYLMVLIQPDGNILFRWGPDGTPGYPFGFGDPPSIAELQKRRN